MCPGARRVGLILLAVFGLARHKSKGSFSTAADPGVSTDFGRAARFGPASACFQVEVG